MNMMTTKIEIQGSRLNQEVELSRVKDGSRNASPLDAGMQLLDKLLVLHTVAIHCIVLWRLQIQ